MDKHLEKFKEYLLANYSKKTTNSYYYMIKKFLRETKTENLSEDIINKYIFKIKDNCPVETANGYIKAIKVLLKFLKKNISTPKILKPIEKNPDRITLEYLENKIIPVAECIFENPLKVKTILYFMFYTGVRRDELLTLKRKNIDLKEREAKLISPKSKKEIVRFFPQEVSNLIGNYFTTELEENNAFNLKKNTVQCIFKTLKPHFRDIKLRPHLLRHSFATYMHEQGADAFDIKNFLGHKNIQSTMKYVRKDKNIMKKKYDKLTRRRKK